MVKIVNFHDVHDINWIDNVICILKSKYDLVNLNELLLKEDNSKRNTKICHITVDDGDKSFYDVIFPVLKKHQVPASIYVSPYVAINRVNFWFQEIVGYDSRKLQEMISEIVNINMSYIQGFSTNAILKCLRIDTIWQIINAYQKQYKPNKKSCFNMNVQELNEVDKSGLISIGAHTQRHPILANENSQSCESEICNSIFGLEEVLGHKIESFAYPNGVPNMDFGQREMSILENCGCKIAFSLEPKNFSEKSNILKVPRFGLTHGSSLFIKTKLLLGSKWDKIRGLKSQNESSARVALKPIIEEATNI